MARRQFGRVRQLPSGRWQARGRTPAGETRALGTFRTKAEASAALAAFETDLSRGQWLPRQDPIRFEQYAERWLATRPLKPRTRESYADHLRLRINRRWARSP